MNPSRNDLRSTIFLVTGVSVLIVLSIYLKIALRPLLESLDIMAMRARWIGDILVNTTIFISLVWFIKRRSLNELAGLGKLPLQNKKLLIVPAILVLLLGTNVFELDATQAFSIDLLWLLIWSLSIGFFEECAIRGLMQARLIKYFTDKKNGILISVIVSSVIFGLLHLIVRNGSICAEIGQVGAAICLGVMFGALLLRTNKLYPIAIIHGLIDFFSSFEDLEGPDQNLEAQVVEQGSQTGELMVILVLMPFLIFGLIQMKKIKPEKIKERISF
ncbi:CPBP family intramembrane metalloprotease [Fulvivirgaceae bacterium BMA10]|uniref:CPBP family intramembrane metalloprotease n=1 Tax=Splendidivirga corallicola TaxID=3051826 RepID=A0ABT8KJ82_9BACT|nr:CPBP family intramembrane metalloprotease [Fulvivirgaceae bacterium BMA10]